MKTLTALKVGSVFTDIIMLYSRANIIIEPEQIITNVYKDTVEDIPQIEKETERRCRFSGITFSATTVVLVYLDEEENDYFP